jgi:hypothetical protein
MNNLDINPISSSMLSNLNGSSSVTNPTEKDVTEAAVQAYEKIEKILPNDGTAPTADQIKMCLKIINTFLAQYGTAGSPSTFDTAVKMMRDTQSMLQYAPSYEKDDDLYEPLKLNGVEYDDKASWLTAYANTLK